MKTVLMGLLLLSTTAAFAHKLDCEVTMAINDGSGLRLGSNETTVKVELDLKSQEPLTYGTLVDTKGYLIRLSKDKVRNISMLQVAAIRYDGNSIEIQDRSTPLYIDLAKFSDAHTLDVWYTHVSNRNFLDVLARGSDDENEIVTKLATANEMGAYKIGDWTELTLSCTAKK